MHYKIVKQVKYENSYIYTVKLSTITNIKIENTNTKFLSGI